jgi:hypothetical protein
MAVSKPKWIVYEFRDKRHVALTRPQPTRKKAEELRDKLSKTGRYKRNALGVGTVSA